MSQPQLPKSALSSQRYSELVGKKAGTPPTQRPGSQTSQVTSSAETVKRHPTSQASSQRSAPADHDQSELVWVPIRRQCSDPSTKVRSKSFDQFQDDAITSAETGKRGFPPSIRSPSSRTNAKDVAINNSTPIAALPYAFLEAAGLLHIGQPLHRGWEKLAGELDFDIESIALFRHESSPVKAVIAEWQSRRSATFGKFIQIMKDMDRSDVIADLRLKLGSQMSLDMAEKLDSWLAGRKSAPF